MSQPRSRRLGGRRAGCLGALALAVAGLLVSMYSDLFVDTYPGRFMRWRASDVDDWRRFPADPVGNAQPRFDFEGGGAGAGQPLASLTIDTGDHPSESLQALAERTATTALLVVRDDRLLFEGYFNGSSRDAVQTSFSIAKSVTSALVGAAVADGHLGGPADPITDYLPELAARDPRFKAITVEHLLQMKSGIAFRDTDAPWGDKPRAYYHPRLRQVVLGLEIAGPPGEAFAYNTYNPILLGMALERATGRRVADYFADRIWRRLGMEFGASWSLDSVEDAMAKMESGLNARAVDFAKLGRLYLEGGRWRGETIVPGWWVARALEPHPGDRVPRFGDNIHYQYGWWVHAPDGRERWAAGGWGHLGQYLYVFPHERMILARFGRELGGVSWPAVFQRIVAAVAPAGDG